MATLNAWIDHARKKDMPDHVRAFWYARDAVEGKLNLPEMYKREAYEFISKNCRESAEKQAVLEALQK
jgi:hypothetical protein